MESTSPIHQNNIHPKFLAIMNKAAMNIVEPVSLW